jgi:hypothetical protein
VAAVRLKGISTTAHSIGNSAQHDGGGRLCDAQQLHCLLQQRALVRSELHRVSTLNYCCTTPLPAGTDNLVEEPQLASASRLSAGSPCIGRGNVAYARGLDVDSEPWANPPAIGCDEYWSGSVTGALSVAVVAAYTNVAPGFALDFQALIEGRVSASRWDFGDGVVVSNRPYTSHVWTNGGDYPVTLTAYNDDHPAGVSVTPWCF